MLVNTLRFGGVLEWIGQTYVVWVYIYCLSMLMADLFFVCHMREIVGGMVKCMDIPISFIFFKPSSFLFLF